MNHISTDKKSYAASALKQYNEYHKGYMVDGTQDSKRSNYILKKSYDKNPISFWASEHHVSNLSSELVKVALFVFSIRSSSASSEREFSRMGSMIRPRRSSFTASNANKVLTLSNLLPQKRRLGKLRKQKEIKIAELFNYK